MSKDEIHVGNLIRVKLKKDRKSKVWLAAKIDCCRTNVYKILTRPSIDTAQLQRISFAMKKNFFVELADFCQEKLEQIEDNKPRKQKNLKV